MTATQEAPARQAPITKIAGICPAVATIYTDETCRTVDEDAYRAHLRFLLRHDIGALVVGSHASEIPALTAAERRLVIGIACEEAGGRVPVIGGIVADSTREAIEQGHDQRDAGADGFLFTPPSIPGWNTLTDVRYVIEHLRAFDRAVNLPLIIFGAPNPAYGGMYNVSAQAIAEIVRAIDNVVACKITSGWNVGIFRAVTRAIKEVRDIGCLKAGGAATYASFAYGGDGNLSGASNFKVADDVAVLNAVRAGDPTTAREISDTWNAVTDVIYGYDVGLPLVPFHYRYKVVAWLLGVIPRPHMRLPQLPPPLRDIEMLHRALVESGKDVVCPPSVLAMAAV